MGRDSGLFRNTKQAIAHTTVFTAVLERATTKPPIKLETCRSRKTGPNPPMYLHVAISERPTIKPPMKTGKGF
jgi:hypothetical protein